MPSPARISLGDLVDSGMALSPIGEIVRKNWDDIPDRFSGIGLDAFVVMPNHIHGIITITDDRLRRGLINQTPTTNPTPINQTPTYQTPTVVNENCPDQPDWIMMKNEALILGKIIRYFKAKTTKMIHDHGSDTFHWQRNYYEHVIRDDEELKAIRQYILSNPANWTTDENYHT
jgi:putative transposase